MYGLHPIRLPCLPFARLFAGFSFMACVVVWGVHPANALPSNLVCSFKAGTSGSYEAGTFKAGTTSPLSFSVEAIDLDGQVAQLKTAADKPPGTLRIVRALNARHFIAAVTEGFLNLTTIYDEDGETGRYPAVHSRHFGVLGQAVYAQYTGYCTAK